MQSNNSVGLRNDAKPLLGDALALFSAIFYALYVNVLKLRIGSEDRIDMQLFFGFVGLANTVAGWPFIIVLHYFGLESFELPQSKRQIAAVIVNVSVMDFSTALPSREFIFR